MKREHALKLRAAIVKASESLPDEDALQAMELYDPWTPDTEFVYGKRVRYGADLYRCEQAHRSEANWTPDITPALWTRVALPGTIPVWQQPTGAQDAYAEGDKVYYPTADDAVWISTVNDNVWQPGVYGWEVFEE